MHDRGRAGGVFPPKKRLLELADRRVPSPRRGELRKARRCRHPTETSCPWGAHTPWGRDTREFPWTVTGVAPC